MGVSETAFVRQMWSLKVLWGAPGELLGGLGHLLGAGPILDLIFPENVPKSFCFTRFGSRPEFETGSTGSTQSSGSGAQLAVSTLGSSRLRPG